VVFDHRLGGDLVVVGACAGARQERVEDFWGRRLVGDELVVLLLDPLDAGTLLRLGGLATRRELSVARVVESPLDASHAAERDRRDHGERAATPDVGAAGGAVFVAMVQGAVHSAVNAADRHGRPYLINRSFPKASPDAAAAAAAFRVLDTLLSATRHATLLAAYTASLEAIPDGNNKS